jgi:hypothetical protein
MNFYGMFALHVAELKIKFDAKARQVHQLSLYPVVTRKYYNTLFLLSAEQTESGRKVHGTNFGVEKYRMQVLHYYA